jgi:hypothetical protein
MYRIIGDDGKEYGPVTPDQVLTWLQEGRADARTKVRAEGTSDWKALGTMPEFSAAFRVASPWKCSKCGEMIEPQFDTCWKCSTPKSAAPAVRSEPPPPPARGRVEYRIFRGILKGWDELFAEAAEFATRIGRERLVGISHSEDKNDGVVAVWYWAPAPEQEKVE